jgi:predicted DNA binding CopG/RHH family protein
MKKKIKYTDGPLGEYHIVEDFLPPPHKLIRKESHVRVTINLNEQSVNVFKEAAKKSHTQYQKIIRNLIDHYAANQLATTTKC